MLSEPGEFESVAPTGVDRVLLATDVQYRDFGATAAAVAFDDWDSGVINGFWVRGFEGAPALYRPGCFYERELPYVLEIVTDARAEARIGAVVVDGHVWLGAGEPGLGARLYEALGGETPVVGIAKSPFHRGVATPVRRGRSGRPLFVSSVGLGQDEASRLVGRMHGAGRIPTVVRRADRLSRTKPLKRNRE